MLAFSNDYYGIIFRATQSVELFCAYQSSANSSFYVLKNITGKTGSASPNGATANATVYTMVEMAKTNALNTYKYLTYLLSQRPNDKMSNEQLEQLAPWSDTAKVNYQN